MPSKEYARSALSERKAREKWALVRHFTGDIVSFTQFVKDPWNADHQKVGKYAMAQLALFADDVRAAAGSGPFEIDVDQAGDQFFVSVSSPASELIRVWSMWKSREAQDAHGDAPVAGGGAACLRTLATLAVGDRKDVRLSYPEQVDAAFAWKASSVHPLQVLENAYQRIVQKAGLEAEDPLTAQSETLSRFFMTDKGEPELFTFRPSNAGASTPLASVRMNHLIDTFYLFRLLVQYRVESKSEVPEELRVELSSNLTKLLHNGDRQKMGWLSSWLTEKIAELGRTVEGLNKGGTRRVIFFLKGGRALNYYLGTPQNGENDWDTQVVINPGLPADEWYRCFSELHDVLLVALTRFKLEFSALVEKNAAAFASYLADKRAPLVGDDEEVDRNELSDVHSLDEHANCKAELIDIGIPRRGSPSALEEWTRLSVEGALPATNGVIYPHRDYYRNEYLMMIRQSFEPGADFMKAPKRIARFGLVLESPNHAGLSPAEQKRLAALPETAKLIQTLPQRRRELFGVIVPQFVEAYNLVQDKDLATLVDAQCVAMINTPPALPPGLANLLDATQQALAADIGAAHQLSTRMDEHWAARSEFIESQRALFTRFVAELATLAKDDLDGAGAQLALAGSFAARLQARHLRLDVRGLEPMRRLLVKLQCVSGADRAAVLSAVRGALPKVSVGKQQLTVSMVEESGKHALLLHWSEEMTIGALSYRPLVMKIRVAEQKGAQLPVLSSLEGLPVLDLRYVAADYLAKTAKIDEYGSRKVLSSATRAVAELLSKFDFASDE